MDPPPHSMMDAINVAELLEDEFGVLCTRGIQVNGDARGKKVPIAPAFMF
eukprot:COSAG01_NODE_4163_length_5278_cov_155.844951_2_plen_50_part_00